MMPVTLNEVLFSWRSGRGKRRRRFRNIPPLAFMYIVWIEINRSVLERVDMNFVP